MKTLAKILALAVLALALTTASAFAVNINIPLNNDTASTIEDNCPAEGGDLGCWHFVITPNSNDSYFIKFFLNLGDYPSLYETETFFLNGTQGDNVFVAVPEGKTLTSLIKDYSYAEIFWDGEGKKTPSKFVLSGYCPPTNVPEPTTLLLLGTGLVGLGFSRKRMK